MRYLNVIIFLLISISVFSQNNFAHHEEKYIELQDKARSNINNNIDSSFYYSNLIEVSSIKHHKAFAKGIKSYLFQLKNDTIQSNYNYKLALEFLSKTENSNQKTRTTALIYNYKGLTNWKRKKYTDALKKYFEAKELAKSIDEKKLTITLNGNIALIYDKIGNFNKAIAITKESDNYIDKNAFIYDDKGLRQNKSLIYLNLGNFYLEKYKSNEDNKKELDSAKFYLQKCILYSKDISRNRFKAEINLATIYQILGNFSEAQSYYFSSLQIAKSNNFEIEQNNIIYNLADLNYYKMDYDKALFYFQKVDSIYKNTKKNPYEYIKSNYFQSIIYNELNNNSKAFFHSKIYIDNYEKTEFKLNNEILRINDFLNAQSVKNEILNIKNKSKNNLILRYVFIFILITSIISLLIFLKRKINSERKIKLVLEKYKNNDLKLKENQLLEETKPLLDIDKTTINGLSLSKEKENEILNKLKDLEEKKLYLKSEFSQTMVAKKLKTNTTYISFVVNKYYNKTFSEYSNELKINYVINEIISNSTYRKYSTQAIAESVGYKNNVSFTKSFNKKTGLTPVQFIKKIESKI